MTTCYKNVSSAKTARGALMLAGTLVSIAALSLASSIAAAQSADAGAGAAKPVLEMKKVVVAQGGQGFLYTPFYVAQAKGFFREQGLEVVSSDVPGIQELAVLANDEAQFAPGTSFAILSAAKGRNLVSVAAIVNETAVDLVLSNAAMQKANIHPTDPIAQRLKALHGMRIGMSSIGSGTDSFVRYVLPRYGVQPDKDVTLVTFGSCVEMLAAMQHKSVDGFLCAPPAPQQAELLGLGKVLFSATAGDVPDVRGGLYLSYFGKPEFIKNNPNTVQAFVNGFTKGLRYIHAHPDEAATITAKYNPGLAPELFNKTFSLFLKAFPETAVIETQSMAGEMAVVGATNPTIGALVKKVDVNALIDNTFAVRAAAQIH
jgi:NitT/TauT family transport system substrate-binding protein